MPDDLTTIRELRDRLGREPTLAEVLDQVRRDHPGERGDVRIERFKIAIAIFRQRRRTLGLDEEAPQRIWRPQTRASDEGHMIALAVLVAFMFTGAVLFSFMSGGGGVVESMARGAGYSIGRVLIDHAFGGNRHRR
jgi:hypothetical protein